MIKLQTLPLVIFCLFAALCSESQSMDNREDLLEKCGVEQKKNFCCDQVIPYRPRRTDHEDLFNSFKDFSFGTSKSTSSNGHIRAIQLVRQENFGPILEKRYFILPDFQEVTGDYFIEHNYKRLNSFKNYKCATHNLFFEVNAYTRSSEKISNHHMSTISGNNYGRDNKSIDLESVLNKGIR